jgi:hypothetical protein
MIGVAEVRYLRLSYPDHEKQYLGWGFSRASGGGAAFAGGRLWDARLAGARLGDVFWRKPRFARALLSRTGGLCPQAQLWRARCLRRFGALGIYPVTARDRISVRNAAAVK